MRCNPAKAYAVGDIIQGWRITVIADGWMALEPIAATKTAA